MSWDWGRPAQPGLTSNTGMNLSCNSLAQMPLSGIVNCTAVKV